MLRLWSKALARVSIAARELQPGMIFMNPNDLSYCSVHSYRHIKTTQGHTVSQVEFLDLSTSTLKKLNLHTEARVDCVSIIKKQATVSYADYDRLMLILVLQESWEEVEISVKTVGGYLASGTEVVLHIDEENMTIVQLGLSPIAMSALKENLKEPVKKSKQKFGN